MEIEELRNIAAIVALILAGVLICGLVVMQLIEYETKKQGQPNDD